jgi:acyl transferase domain-containing protein/acyl carrier protein
MITQEQIEKLLIDSIATRFGADSLVVDPEQPLAELGLDSAAALAVAQESGARLGIEIDPTVFFSDATVRSAARTIASGNSAGAQRGQTAAAKAVAPEPAAVIGLACRFPGVASPDAMWQMLNRPQEVEAEHRNECAATNASNGKAIACDVASRRGDPSSEQRVAEDRAAGAVPPVGRLGERFRFDAGFFRLRPDEVVGMDPQQRWLLELTWDALEDAGLDPHALRGRKIGVFIGTSGSDYLVRLSQARDLTPSDVLGNSLSITANRLSYSFDWRGPSLAVDTACSSSLTALHLALRSLRAGECELAVIGGAGAIVDDGITAALNAAGMLAQDGRCKTFDASADGYARSEGVGVAVLGRLSECQQAGARIYACVAGSAMTQDGRTNGLTAPNRDAQVSVIRAACADAGLKPDDVSFVECHGTGTYLGDPIEIKALAEAYGTGGGRRLKVASAKTHLGHLEAAAGVAGLLRTVLSLHHGRVPPVSRLDRPNPLIPFEELEVDVVHEPGGFVLDGPAVAGVSSFGFGGTNVHALLCSAPAHTRTVEPPAEGNRVKTIVPISAHSEVALQERCQQWATWIEEHPDTEFQDVVSTLGHRRAHLDVRRALIASSREELIAALKQPMVPTKRERRPKALFVFAGQGCQRPGMGRDLEDLPAAARALLRRCDEVVRDLEGWSLIEALSEPEESSRLMRTEIAQPCIFAWQAALYTAWRAWGVTPAAVCGHSVGEIAAAYASGVLSIEDAMRLALARGRSMRDLAGRGAMLAVEMSEAEVAAVSVELPDLRIAALTAPVRLVLSGPKATLTALAERLQGKERRFARWVSSDYPFHHPLCASAAQKLHDEILDIRFASPSIDWISTVSARVMQDNELTAEYWQRQMLSPVRYAQAVAASASGGITHVIEMGAQPTLRRPTLETLEAEGKNAVLIQADRAAGPNDSPRLQAIAEWFEAGGRLNFAAGLRRFPYRARGPQYAWRGDHYLPPEVQPNRRAQAEGRFLLSHDRVPPWAGRTYTARVDPRRDAWLKDHVIQDRILLPAAAYIEMLLECASEVAGAPPWKLTDLAFVSPLALGDETVELVITLDEERQESEEPAWRASIAVERAPGDWVVLCRATVSRGGDLTTPTTGAERDLDPADLYRELRDAGYGYGPDFQTVRALKIGEASAAGSLQGAGTGWLVDPTVLDGMFHLLGAAKGGRWSSLVVPARVRELTFRPTNGSNYTGHCVLTDFRNGPIAFADFGLAVDDTPVLTIGGAVFTKLALDEASGPIEGHRYVDVWRPKGDDLAEGKLVIFLGGEFADRLAERVGTPSVAIRTAGELRGVLDGLPANGAGLALCDLRWLDTRETESEARALAHAFADIRDTIRVLAETHFEGSLEYELVSAATAQNGSVFAGLLRTARLECPIVISRLILVGEVPEDRLIDRLVDEAHAEPDETEVALGESSRQVRRLVPGHRSLTGRPLPIHPDGCYLVTGGLGGIGLNALRWLAERGAKQLLTVTRKRTAASDSLITELAQQGAELRVVEGDLAEAELGDALEKAIGSFGPLRGVLHLAGTLSDGAMFDLNETDFVATLLPKLAVRPLVERLATPSQLDWLIGFGSAASVLGSPGQANYAAANSALAAQFAAMAKEGWPARCIHWGPWAEAGMAARAKAEGASLNTMGLTFFSHESGFANLTNLLRQTTGEDLVTPFDLKNLLQYYPEAPGFGIFAELLDEGSTQLRSLGNSERLAPRPELSTPYVPPQTDVEKAVVAIWKRSLVLEKVGMDDSFFELGGDSVFAGQILFDIGRHFGITLGAAAAFEAFTPRALSQMIDAELRNQRIAG